jgi:archaellum component FlaC
MKNASTSAEKRQLFEQKKEALKDFKENASSSRKEFNEKEGLFRKAERMKITLKVTLMKLDANIARVTKIVEKLDSRIAKIKSAGGDTSKAETLSSDAKKHIDEAKAVYETLKTTTPTEENKETIKNNIESVKNHLEEAKKTVEMATKALKDLKINKTASTTSSI